MQGLGKNQWYEIKLPSTAGVSSPTLDTFLGKQILDEQVVNDGTTLPSFNADAFDSLTYTNVYLSQDKDISFNYVSDNNSTIFVNNQQAYFNNYIAYRPGTINYLQNSDFQNGTKGWTLSAGMSLDTTKKMVPFSNSIKVDITGKTTDVWTPMYSNFIPCAPGDVVSASVYVITDDLTTDTGSNGWWMEVEWWDNTGSSRLGRATINSRINPSANNVWQRTSGPATAIAGTTKCRLRIHANQNGRFWVTQPQLEKASSTSSYYPNVLLSLKKGWNMIDIALNEGAGGQGLFFGQKLSELVDDMSYVCNENDFPNGIPDRIKQLRKSSHISPVVAHGQITIADYTDVGTATAYISSSASKTQVYDSDTGAYSPDWSTSNPVLTPSLFISKDSTNTDKITSAKSIKWYDSASPTTPLASAGDFSISSIATGGKLTIKNNVMTGTTTSKTYICEVVYTDTDTGFDIQLKAEYSFNRVKNGAKGGDVVVASTLLPDGSLFTNSIGRLSAKMEVYEAGVLTVPYSYEWFIRYPGAMDEGLGRGWKLITSSNQAQLGIEGIVNSSLIYITPAAVNNVTAFRVRVTHKGNPYYDSFTIYDTTDPVKLNITSSSGDIFKNGQINTTLRANLIRNGEELDVDGTQYFYQWSKYSADGTKDNTFNKSGKELAITANDVASRATFTVDVLQKITSLGKNLLTKSGNFTELSWGTNAGSVLSLDTIDGFNVIKAVGGSGLSENGQTKLSPNTEYIYSIEFMCNQKLTISNGSPTHMWLQVGSNVHTEITSDIGGDLQEPMQWCRRWIRLKTTADGGLFKGFCYVSPSDSNRIFWLKNAQLEEVGPAEREPTAWSPSWKDEGSTVKGNYNFLINGGPYKTRTQTGIGWDESLNGTTVIDGGWSSGYNSGLTTANQGYHAHVNTTKFAYPVIEMINKNSQFGFKNRWLGMSQGLITGGFTSYVKPGQRYTLTIEVMTDTLGTFMNGGIYHYVTGSDAMVFGNSQKNFAPNDVINTWQKRSISFYIEDNWDTSRTNNVSVYLYGHQSTTEGIMWIRNVKLEEGINSTDYTVNNWDKLPMAIDEPNLTPNMIKDGNFAKGGTGLTGFGGGATVVDNVFMGYKGLNKTVPATGYYDTIIDIKADPRKEYTMSFYAKGKFRAFAVPMKDNTGAWNPTSTEYHDNMLQVDSQAQFSYYIQTTKKTPTDTQRIRFIFRTEAGTNISTESYITLIKVEEGTMATVWQPAIGE